MYLRKHGATVNMFDDADRQAFRKERQLPQQASSCHTVIVEGYVIEGHVPAGAIDKLLTDRPDAIGLALPGMPPDSPGMGGDLKSWENQPVLLVTADGGLAPFDY